MPSTGVAPAPVNLPDLTPIQSFAQTEEEKYAGHNWVWDKLGRAVFGDNDDDGDGQHGGLLGDVPLVGDIMRAPGNVWGGISDAGGVGIGMLVGGAAEGLARVPATAFGAPPNVADAYGLGDPMGSKVNAWDTSTYTATPEGAIRLLEDLKKENGGGNLSAQFMVLGQWQKQHDPQAFAAWEETLKAAQDSTNIGSKAAEILSSYIREWGAAYYDMTSAGLEGWFEVAPELAFTNPGSAGQVIGDALGLIGTAQRHAEKGAAVLAGTQGGFGAFRGHQVYEGNVDVGSRMNELLYLADNDPQKLGVIESAAVEGMREMGWTADHAYNYLVRHGQGFSAEGLTQVSLSLALDPTLVAGAAAGLGSSIGTKAAVAGYGNTATSAGRVNSVYRSVAQKIGTTVSEVRADPILGPALKTARAVVDPFTAFGKTPEALAKVDVLAAGGLKAMEKAYGASAVKNVAKFADRYGFRDILDEAVGVSAMNYTRKWLATKHIENLLKFMDPSTRRELSEELIEAEGRNAPRDAVTRIADFIFSRRVIYLSDADKVQLRNRVATMSGKPLSEVAADLDAMGIEELSLLHSATYSDAWKDFVTARNAVDPKEWGMLANHLDELVPLNPNKIDNVSAQGLYDSIVKLIGENIDLDAIKEGTAKLPTGKPVKAAIKAWNEAADRFEDIAVLGKVTTGGAAQLYRKINRLSYMIQEGQFHNALGLEEMASLPKSFVRDFLGKWSDDAGEHLWRLGYKPKAQQATGLRRDASGKLRMVFEPNIDNVTTAIPRVNTVSENVTDALGRIIPQAVKDSRVAGVATKAYDSLDVALRTATDMVSGERVMASMEQRFRTLMRKHPSGRFNDRMAKDIFKVAREYQQDRGYTIAGMSPDDFWKATKDQLIDVVDADVAKRDIFNMLLEAAGGDMRVLGVTNGMTQRIRSGLVSRGLDPNNYTGALTVSLYNMMRYTLNPLFFFQSLVDAPWFNMYRGVMPDIRGRAPAPGTPMFEMQGVMSAMSRTTLGRALQMDYTERIATIGYQMNVMDALKQVPGLEQGLGTLMKARVGQMITNNELLFINSQIGDIVVDAIATTKRALADRAAAAGTAEEAAQWANQSVDIERVFEHLTDEMTDALGRAPTKSELGLRYFSEMINDSKTAVMTKDGLLSYQDTMRRGGYFDAGEVGQLKPLHLDYGASSLGLPNVRTALDLKEAISRGVYTTSDVRDIMKQAGYQKANIKRFMDALMFNWEDYFNGLRRELGMSRYEMDGIEDLIAREAQALDLKPVEYLTQVLAMTAKKETAAARAATKAAKAGAPIPAVDPTDGLGLTEHMRATLDVMRAAAKGEAGIDEMTKVVANHLHPSMKQTLLDHFMERITGKNGLIEQAMAAGDTKAAQDYNLILEDLKGGWGARAIDEFRDLVIRRAGGEAIGVEPEVERAVAYFSKFVNSLNPKVVAGDMLKDIIDRIPVEGASPYNFTQAVLMDTMAESFRLAEKDAIRLAHMQTERTVLERVMNHPFWAMYPSSYFWGKVIPETFKFIATDPFGMRTSLGAQTYTRVKQSIELQSLYDDRMKALWDRLGKSAVLGLISYTSPAMPWEDMTSYLPPWYRAITRDGIDLMSIYRSEANTIAPDRWVRSPIEAIEEVGDWVSTGVDSLTQGDQNGLEQISIEGATPTTEQAPEGFAGPVTGMDLGPVLAGEMADLQSVLSR